VQAKQDRVMVAGDDGAVMKKGQEFNIFGTTQFLLCSVRQIQAVIWFYDAKPSGVPHPGLRCSVSKVSLPWPHYCFSKYKIFAHNKSNNF
jgi:hypothetical protein